MAGERAAETFTIHGVQITPRQLAEQRQAIAHGGDFNIDLIPPWGGLSAHEQHMAELDARNYLLALNNLTPILDPPTAPPKES